MTEVTAMKMTSVSESGCGAAPCVSLPLVKLPRVSLQRPIEALAALDELSQMPAAAASHESPAACCSRVLSARTAEAATATPPANATLADAIPETNSKCKFIHLVCMSALGAARVLSAVAETQSCTLLRRAHSKANCAFQMH